MDYCNFTLFEVLKYKIEIENCLEYCQEGFKSNIKDIEKNLVYLKSNFDSGSFYTNISVLYTDYNLINKPLIDFFETYKLKKIVKMIKSKKLDAKLEFMKMMIDCNVHLDNLMKAFEEEPEIAKRTNNKLKKLLLTSNNHFKHFCFFICYHYVACHQYKKKVSIKYKKESLNELYAIINYLNSDGAFDSYLDSLDQNEEQD